MVSVFEIKPFQENKNINTGTFIDEFPTINVALDFIAEVMPQTKSRKYQINIEDY